ncbi:MAG: DUF4019 domain-containing protein [Deltaproteobacteria bacterium]|nr:DUF4019 domain-containing protein [Deltaproteobacteria bacterium]
MADPRDKSDKSGPSPGSSDGSIEVQFSSTQLPRVVDAEPSGRVRAPTAEVSGPVSDGVPRGRRERAPTLSGRVVEGVVDGVSHLVPKTRKSRVLVRSVIVAFLVVAGWIGGLVYWQWRGGQGTDFRPFAEHILTQLRDEQYDKVYDEASPRFQEIVVEESFENEMLGLRAILGKFVEISAVTGTENIRGPSGQTARVALIIQFERGSARGSISFHKEDGVWRMVGITVEVPAGFVADATSEVAKHARSEGPPELVPLAEAVLRRIAAGDTDGVRADADALFQGAVSKAVFADLEATRSKVLGKFVAVYGVTSNHQSPSRQSADLVLLVTYDRAQTTVHFSFRKQADTGTWKLTSYKPILPAPRVPSGATP